MTAGANRTPPRVAGVVLAAGLSRRMGRDKLLLAVDGAPMVRHAVEAALGGGLSPVVVVVGPGSVAVRRALEVLPVSFARNARPDEGLSSSLRVGVQALAARTIESTPEPSEVEGAVVLLGDMPWVTATDVHRLVGAFDPGAGRRICVPIHAGRRGNPVLWDRRYFAELVALHGDSGARRLLEVHAAHVCEVPVDGDGVLRDVDTPEALAATRARA